MISPTPTVGEWLVRAHYQRWRQWLGNGLPGGSRGEAARMLSSRRTDMRAPLPIWGKSGARCSRKITNLLISLVGAGRFELPTPCSRRNGPRGQFQQDRGFSALPGSFAAPSIQSFPGRSLGGIGQEVGVVVPVDGLQRLNGHAEVAGDLRQIDAGLHQPRRGGVP